MAELGALRAAKQAYDESLITQQDFDVVKVAFLKAQQIKAGLDAGFIRREDYDKAVGAYLHAMDFQVMSAMPSLTAAAPRVPVPAPPPAAPLSYTQPAAVPAPGVSLGASRPSSYAGSGAATHLLPSRNSSASGQSADAGVLPVGSGSLSAQTSVSDDGAALQDIPADLPDYCKGATAGKKSMSGIAIDEACVNLFMHMKTRKAYKWLIFKVDDSGRMVVPDRIGGNSSSYNDFICALPENQCRYAVYDYEYRSAERGTIKKLVFLLWAPDNTGVKPKMMYASTKDFFKGFLEGIGTELQANEPSEISEDEIKERVLSNMSRK